MSRLYDGYTSLMCNGGAKEVFKSKKEGYLHSLPTTHCRQKIST